VRRWRLSFDIRDLEEGWLSAESWNLGTGGEGWEGMGKMVWWGEGRREGRGVDWEDETVRYTWRGWGLNLLPT
jgi:hypothetical protein